MPKKEIPDIFGPTGVTGGTGPIGPTGATGPYYLKLDEATRQEMLNMFAAATFVKETTAAMINEVYPTPTKLTMHGLLKNKLSTLWASLKTSINSG